MKPDILRYSIQLSMLRKLLSKKLITEKEYKVLKAKLMQDYKIT